MSERHGVAQVVRTVKGSQGLPLRNHSRELSGRGARPSAAVAPELLGGPRPPSPHWCLWGFRLRGEAVSGPLASTPCAGTAGGFHREPFALTGRGARMRVQARHSPGGPTGVCTPVISSPPLLPSPDGRWTPRGPGLSGATRSGCVEAGPGSGCSREVPTRPRSLPEPFPDPPSGQEAGPLPGRS